MGRRNRRSHRRYPYEINNKPFRRTRSRETSLRNRMRSPTWYDSRRDEIPQQASRRNQLESTTWIDSRRDEIPQQASPRHYRLDSPSLIDQRREQISQQTSPQHLSDQPSRWIDPRKGSESDRLDLAARLVKIIVSFGGKTTLKCLENQLFEIHNWKFEDSNHGLRDFIDDFKRVFILHGLGGYGNHRKETVTCNLDLDICPTNIRNAGTCSGSCGALHVCKFYLLSQCDIKDCRFGHELKSDPHNLMVLKRRLVNKLDLQEIKNIFRSISNRHGPTIPSTCTYYNARGCKNKGCPFLHICQHYIDGDCKFKSSCKRSHNLLDHQPRKLLEKYGLDNESLGLLFGLIKTKPTTNVSNILQNVEPKQGTPFRGFDAKYSKFKCNEEKINVSAQTFVDGPNYDIESVSPTTESTNELSNGRYDDKLSNFVIGTVENKMFSNNSNTGKNKNKNTISNSQTSEDETTFDTDNMSTSSLETIKSTEEKTMETMNIQTNLNETDNGKDKIEITKTKEVKSERPCVTNKNIIWQFTEHGKTIKNIISESERKNIEQKYQAYLTAKEQYLTIDNTGYKIDFSTMEGSAYGSENGSGIQLIRSVRGLPIEETTTEQ